MCKCVMLDCAVGWWSMNHVQTHSLPSKSVNVPRSCSHRHSCSLVRVELMPMTVSVSFLEQAKPVFQQWVRCGCEKRWHTYNSIKGEETSDPLVLKQAPIQVISSSFNEASMYGMYSQPRVLSKARQPRSLVRETVSMPGASCVVGDSCSEMRRMQWCVHVDSRSDERERSNRKEEGAMQWYVHVVYC